MKLVTVSVVTWKDFDISGRTAVVTASSRGIGRSIALRFARAGADLAVCSRHGEQLEPLAKKIQEMGRRCLTLEANLSHSDGITRFFEEVFKVYPKLDILVNNIGVNPAMAPLHELPEKSWDKVMNANLKGYFLASQMAVKSMIEGGGGVIINLSSYGAVKPTALGGAYCVSKAGVNMLTQVMAQEVARYHIRVNAICPGLIKTQFSKALWNNPELLELRVKNSALRRIGEPDEVAGLALFLASDASSFITGECFMVTGGRI